MENGHSQRHHSPMETIDKSGMTCTRRDNCVYVNQNNDSPILWRFSACPTPFELVAVHGCRQYYRSFSAFGLRGLFQADLQSAIPGKETAQTLSPAFNARRSYAECA